MSSVGNTPTAPRLSVFISYASEDRTVARLLRDRLMAAGLDAWYDESELGGGDTWDQKIRRQIRDCDYFMPVISATTERRKEGYFRREWRLAVDRTLDMADDVLFLLPVVIDETLESSARVPEKFLSVQWLRAPGGASTAALDSLMQRLLAGEHTLPPRPPLMTRPPMQRAATMPPMAPNPVPGAHAVGPPAGSSPAQTVPHGSNPPPMPPFPPAPEKGGIGHWAKFGAEVVWWVLTAAWLVFTRLPRWLRIILSIWLVFMLISTCNRDADSSRDSNPKSRSKRESPPPANTEIERAANATGEQIVAAIEKSAKDKDWGKVGEEIGRRFGQVIGQAAAVGKTLVAAPFPREPGDVAASQFAQTVFSSCYGQLVLARRNDVTVSPELPGGDTDSAFATLGQHLQVSFVLGARFTKNADGSRSLAVRLIQSEGGTIAWSGDFPAANSNATEVGTKIAEAILPLLPRKK